MKKLKGFDGLAMSIGNGHAESAERGAENRLSQRFVNLFPFYMNIARNVSFFLTKKILSYFGGSWRGNQILFSGIEL